MPLAAKVVGTVQRGDHLWPTIASSEQEAASTLGSAPESVTGCLLSLTQALADLHPVIIPVPTDEPAVIFTRFARDWFRLLARGEFDGAVSRLDDPNSYGESWGVEKIHRVLRDYAHGESVPVTDPDTLTGDGRGYSFEHDVPVDGKWSDLTAQFEFLRRPTGYAVVLHDIHVL